MNWRSLLDEAEENRRIGVRKASRGYLLSGLVHATKAEIATNEALMSIGPYNMLQEDEAFEAGETVKEEILDLKSFIHRKQGKDRLGLVCIRERRKHMSVDTSERLLKEAAALSKLKKYSDAKKILIQCLKRIDCDAEREYHIATLAAASGLPIPNVGRIPWLKAAALFNLGVQEEYVGNLPAARENYLKSLNITKQHNLSDLLPTSLSAFQALESRLAKKPRLPSPTSHLDTATRYFKPVHTSYVAGNVQSLRILNRIKNQRRCFSKS